MARKKIEISVEDTATLLGVSTRMVRNYIREKRLKAVKVGRSWFVDKDSAVRLQQATGSREAGPAEPCGNDAEVAEVAEAAKTGERRNGSKERRVGPARLACYRLCKENLHGGLWGKDGDHPFANRLAALKREMFEELGAGYYSFGQQKVTHYRRARSALGAALGLIHADDRLVAKFRDDLETLEKKLMPAFSSLLRKIEREKPKDSAAGT